MVVWQFYLRPKIEGAAKKYVRAFQQKYIELERASARVTCLLTLDRERVAEMHVPLIYMAFVAIRMPQLGGFTAKNTCQRDDERKAFHAAPPRNYPRPTPHRRRGIERNDAVVCSEQTIEGQRRRRPGSRAPRPRRRPLDGI